MSRRLRCAKNKKKTHGSYFFVMLAKKDGLVSVFFILALGFSIIYVGIER